jgi:hypothetical protein
MSTLAVLGACPKVLAIAAKAKVLRDLGLGAVDVVLIEQRAVAWMFDQIRPTLRTTHLTQVEAVGDTTLALILERDNMREALVVG